MPHSGSTFWANRNKIKKRLTNAFACGTLNMSQARADWKEDIMKEFHWITDEERRAERAYIRRELAKDAEREDRDDFLMGLVLCIGMLLMVLPICF